MKTYIGFKADDMLVGPKPVSEEISLSDFIKVLACPGWESRCAHSDTEHVRALQALTGISLPVGSSRLRYMARGDTYIEVKIDGEGVRFFRYSLPLQE